MTPAYLAQVSPTYLENWNEALRRRSVRATDWPLNDAETEVLALCSQGRGKTLSHEASRVWTRLAARLDEALADYPGGAFVRLGSRSGKDSHGALCHGLRVTDGARALSVLADNSRRVAYDLRLARRCGYRPHIFVREWQEIPRWAEFRCFMRERRLLGLSQYDWRNATVYPEIAAHAGPIRLVLDSFFDWFHQAAHLKTVVCDVFLTPGADGFEARLLELNPFLPQTDACLFTWRGGGDFDGSFRFNTLN